MTRKQILDKAADCVCKDREDEYGTPENSFNLIANLWSDYLGKDLSSVDVAMMMVLLKVARIRTGRFKADSFVDGAGYFACGGEIGTVDNT